MDLSKLEKVPTPVDVEADHKAAAARKYLQSTDWYAVRFMETGKEVPEEVKTAREAAREILS